jgi:hypothetical protein
MSDWKPDPVLRGYETLLYGRSSMVESMSLGAQRVRESFNPSKDDMVDKIKRYTADLIDLCEEIKTKAQPYSTLGEQMRLVALAQTAYEEAAMWAVKAATATKK